MRTTFDIDDDLYGEIKLRAEKEKRTVPEFIEAGLRLILNDKTSGLRATLPVIDGGHPAKHSKEMTPDRVFEVLLEADVENSRAL